MKLTKLIAALEKVYALNGDLEVFDCNYFPECFVRVESNEGLPSDWDMPKTFVRIGDQV
jgi:hypothetical protein